MNAQQHSSNTRRNEMIDEQDNNSTKDTVTSAFGQDKRRRRINRWCLSGCGATSAWKHLYFIVMSTRAERVVYILMFLNKMRRKNTTHNSSLHWLYKKRHQNFDILAFVYCASQVKKNWTKWNMCACTLLSKCQCLILLHWFMYQH
jgi:hypothetical protein